MELKVGEQQILEKALQMLHDHSRDELLEKRPIPGEHAAVIDCMDTIRKIFEICQRNEFEVDVDLELSDQRPAKPNRLTDFTIFGFNTGRAYTEKGQRISVGYKLDPTEESGILVLFCDHDRMIDGRLKTEKLNGAMKLFIEKNNCQRAKYVMGLYDNGAYQYHVQANWLDAEDFPVIAL
jgi:hypothetical protein